MFLGDGAEVAVAVLAGCSEVAGVVPFASPCDGCDVVDGGCVECASWQVDLALMLVALEDAFADGLPSASVDLASLFVSA